MGLCLLAVVVREGVRGSIVIGKKSAFFGGEGVARTFRFSATSLRLSTLTFFAPGAGLSGASIGPLYYKKYVRHPSSPIFVAILTHRFRASHCSRASLRSQKPWLFAFYQWLKKFCSWSAVGWNSHFDQGDRGLAVRYSHSVSLASP
jgi:hypothetical protein